MISAIEDYTGDYAEYINVYMDYALLDFESYNLEDFGDEYESFVVIYNDMLLFLNAILASVSNNKDQSHIREVVGYVLFENIPTLLSTLKNVQKLVKAARRNL